MSEEKTNIKIPATSFRCYAESKEQFEQVCEQLDLPKSQVLEALQAKFVKLVKETKHELSEVKKEIVKILNSNSGVES